MDLPSDGLVHFRCKGVKQCFSLHGRVKFLYLGVKTSFQVLSFIILFLNNGLIQSITHNGSPFQMFRGDGLPHKMPIIMPLPLFVNNGLVHVQEWNSLL